MLQLRYDKNSRQQALANHRPEACNFIKKETLAQVFSCEFCEISKNAFSYRTPPVAAFVVSLGFQMVLLHRSSSICEVQCTTREMWTIYKDDIFEFFKKKKHI